MAAQAMTLLLCDQCAATVGPLPGGASQARSIAQWQHGWMRLRGTHGYMGDWCPACAKTRRVEQATELVRRMVEAR